MAVRARYCVRVQRQLTVFRCAAADGLGAGAGAQGVVGKDVHLVVAVGVQVWELSGRCGGGHDLRGILVPFDPVGHLCGRESELPNRPRATPCATAGNVHQQGCSGSRSPAVLSRTTPASHLPLSAIVRMSLPNILNYLSRLSLQYFFFSPPCRIYV